jgi:hypothetical protein
MEDLMKSFEKFRDTCNEMASIFNTEVNRKEYDDLNIKSINGERFACRNYISEFYSQLTEEQKKLVAKIQILLEFAFIEDKYDSEYNLKNYDELNNNFPTKGEIKWKI